MSWYTPEGKEACIWVSFLASKSNLLIVHLVRTEQLSKTKEWVLLLCRGKITAKRGADVFWDYHTANPRLMRQHSRDTLHHMTS